MIHWLKRLVWDESAFLGYVRVLVFLLGQAIDAGNVPFTEGFTWVGDLVSAAALLVRSRMSEPEK